MYIGTIGFVVFFYVSFDRLSFSYCKTLNGFHPCDIRHQWFDYLESKHLKHLTIVAMYVVDFYNVDCLIIAVDSVGIQAMFSAYVYYCCVL